MAILSGSRVALAATAIIATLGGVVYNRVSGDKAAVAALPSAPWIPFEKGQANVIFKDQLKYCEDAVFDHEKGMAILSCDLGRAEWNTVMGTMYDPTPKGTLYIYNYASKTSLKPLKLIGHPPTSDFHPLGINFFRQKGGFTRLFVINHQRNGSTIDIFDLSYTSSTATFITSISDNDNHIISPNAIAPISYTSFYVTNDHRFIPRLHKFLNILETFGSLPLSWVTLVNFSSPGGVPIFTTAASNIGFANGIVLTPTGKEVIVASTTDVALWIYDRDPATNLLTFREKIPVLFRPDNLTFDDGLDVDNETAFDKEGKFLRGLIAAGHPAPLRLYAVSRDPVGKSAPSWVVEVRRGEGEDEAPYGAMGGGKWKGGYYLRTLYQNDGSYFGTSSTGTVDFARRRMLVSGLYAKGMLEVSW